ncbi:hypothetical protein LMG33818_000813 [Halomonadaceae bacterium LMG 33818]|uniref:two-partner secretion domain-containing protein n=1 Tax=Cernens ardua TaxID=3402176 RepID=UPI003EDC0A5F
MAQGYIWRRLMGTILIITMTSQYTEAAWGAAITPINSNTSVRVENGHTIVNIATPNKQGISHNTYQQFNIDSNGIVLNNLKNSGNSALAGNIAKNPNLRHGAAHLIINEVSSNTPTQLDGQVDIAGQKAALLIANPNGITCNGCKFTNTPGVTLTTGQPSYDNQGALAALDVHRGTIVIGPNGLQGTYKSRDGSSPNYIELISHVAQIEGHLSAHQLNVTLGHNHLDYGTGTITDLGSEKGYKPPSVALDSTAIGGMYADRIRLIATENGVGVNTGNLSSAQDDITIESAGPVQAGNMTSNQDINIRAPSINIPTSSTLQSNNDATLISQSLNNNGVLKSKGDIRLLADNVNNNGNNALIQAQHNLTIQKDGTGDKSTSVTNQSGIIRSIAGDVVIRTSSLNNKRQTLRISSQRVVPHSHNVNKQVGIISFVNSHGEVVHQEPLDGVVNVGGNWFGQVDMASHPVFNTARNQDVVVQQTNPAQISAGNSAYINATNLDNDASIITANNNLYLAGENLTNNSWKLGQENTYTMAAGTTSVPNKTLIHYQNHPTYVPWHTIGQYQTWTQTGVLPATIHAGNQLAMDFGDSIHLQEREALPGGEVHLPAPSTSVSANSILLHSGYVHITTGMNASNATNIISTGPVDINAANIHSGQALWISGDRWVSVNQSDLSSNQIDILSRNDNLTLSSADNMFDDTQESSMPEISAPAGLTLQAGKSIFFKDMGATHVGSLSMIAGDDINITSDNDYLKKWAGAPGLTHPNRQNLFNERYSNADAISTDHDLSLTAGDNLNFTHANLNAQGTLNLNAGQDISLPVYQPDPAFSSYFNITRTPEEISTLYGRDGVNIDAGRNLSLPASNINSSSNLNLIAGRNETLGSLVYRTQSPDGSYDDHVLTTHLHSVGDTTLSANGSIHIHGGQLISDGSTHISSGADTSLFSVVAHNYHVIPKGYTKGTNQNIVFIRAKNDVDITSLGSLLFQASKIISTGGNLNAAAQGGFLFAQAQEDTSHYQVKKKKKILGGVLGHKHYEHTHDDIVNHVAIFKANQNITLLSKDDSTYQASKISAGKNAQLISQQGKINFEAVKNTDFDQTISSTSGLYIKSTNKGYQNQTWELPHISTGGQLTIDAAQGITADIKQKDGQTLDQAVNALATTPGLGWLKDLNHRNDVQWDKVQDAYTSWNHTHTSLNPVVSTVLAIAVAAATSTTTLGAGLSFGLKGVTGAALSGAGMAGMSALTSEAAVDIVSNKGNLSKTFQQLGSSSSVKSIISAMAINGSLSALDNTLFNQAPTPGSATRPMLSNWDNATERVAGESFVEASINHTIYGGSYKNELVNTLLGNIGSQVQAEGANIIGDNGQVFGADGSAQRAISHAVLAGMSAEIGEGNVKGAVAGSLSAELATISMGDNVIAAQDWEQKSNEEAELVKALGGTAGAVFTNSSSGANSGATAAENTFRYNYLSHHQKELENQELAQAKTLEEKASVEIQWGLTSQTQNGAMAAGVIAGVPTDFVDFELNILNTVSDPEQLFSSLVNIIQNDRWIVFGDAIKQEYLQRIDNLRNNYEHAGIQGAYNTGLETGKLLTDIALTGADGAGLLKFATNSSIKAIRILSIENQNYTPSLWTSWAHYPKVIIDNKTYAKIGNLLYTRHAVDRMQPSGLGTPAGSDKVGLSISPNLIESILNNGNKRISMQKNESRYIYTSDNLGVVTDKSSKVIITIRRFK